MLVKGAIPEKKSSYSDTPLLWFDISGLNLFVWLIYNYGHNTHILTHWGRVTHIYVSELTITGSDNGLSPGRRQAIFWTNAGILLIRTLGANFSEILSAIHAFSFTKMHLKMSSAKWRQFCLGLNVLSYDGTHFRWGLMTRFVSVLRW